MYYTNSLSGFCKYIFGLMTVLRKIFSSNYEGKLVNNYGGILVKNCEHTIVH